MNSIYVKTTLVFVYILVIVIGTVVYALLEGGVTIPVLEKDGLYKFNVTLLSVVVFVGLMMYVCVGYRKGDGV